MALEILLPLQTRKVARENTITLHLQSKPHHQTFQHIIQLIILFLTNDYFEYESDLCSNEHHLTIMSAQLVK